MLEDEMRRDEMRIDEEMKMMIHTTKIVLTR